MYIKLKYVLIALYLVNIIIAIANKNLSSAFGWACALLAVAEIIMLDKRAEYWKSQCDEILKFCKDIHNLNKKLADDYKKLADEKMTELF